MPNTQTQKHYITLTVCALSPGVNDESYRKKKYYRQMVELSWWGINEKKTGKTRTKGSCFTCYRTSKTLLNLKFSS